MLCMVFVVCCWLVLGVCNVYALFVVRCSLFVVWCKLVGMRCCLTVFAVWSAAGCWRYVLSVACCRVFVFVGAIRCCLLLFIVVSWLLRVVCCC